MIKNKTLFRTLLAFVAVVFCTALLVFSISFAETQNSEGNNSIAQTTEQPEATAETTPEGEEAVVPDEPINPEVIDPEIVDPKLNPEAETTTEEASSTTEELATSGQKNSCGFDIFLSDGITPAQEGEGKDYQYTEQEDSTPGVVSVFRNDLVITNHDSSIPVNDVIQVFNENTTVNKLTLRNINISLLSNVYDAIRVEDNFTTDYTFDLFIEGNCKIEIPDYGNSVKSLYYDTSGKGYKNFNLIGGQSSTLSINTGWYPEGIEANAQLSSILTFSLCGDLKLYADTYGAIFIESNNDDQNMDARANLIIKDNVNMITDHDYNAGIYCTGNVTIQDNAYVNITANDSGIECDSDPNEAVWIPTFCVLGNACVDIQSLSYEALALYGTSVVINTTGYVNAVSQNGLAYSCTIDETTTTLVGTPSLNIISGSLYLTSDTEFGVFQAEKPFEMNVADSYKIVGSPNYSEPITDLVSKAYLDNAPETEEFYTMYVDDEANEPQLAQTVAFIPPEAPTPTPEPAPGEETIAAQTGDGMGSVVTACAIAAIASAGYVLSRRLRKN